VPALSTTCVLVCAATCPVNGTNDLRHLSILWGASLRNELVVAYMQQFFGYGDLSSPLWFVGMEEGVGKESLEDRLRAWDKLGRTETTDIRESHRLIDEKRWFDGAFPEIQRTWRRLIIIAQGYYGLPTSKEAIRKYQKDRLVTKEAVLELMPLPHKTLASWDHDHLYPDKSSYRATIAPLRIAWYKEKLEAMRPKAVVFHGTTPPYPEYWFAIAGSPFQPKDGWSFRKVGNTVFVICAQARGLSDGYFREIGTFLRTEFA
jgi:hypothetical protein